MPTFITDFVARTAQTEAYSDETILIDYRSLAIASNAAASFSGYLAAACGAAKHRPHLFDSFFVPVVDSALWMETQTLEQFWEDADYAVQQDQNNEPQCQHFGADALEFYHQNLRQNEPALARLLHARLHPTT